MPQENYQKIKLLKIMEILRQETDEEHPMTKAELCDRLISMNISCNIRSLNRDIPLLNEQGYEIMETMIGREKGYAVPAAPVLEGMYAQWELEKRWLHGDVLTG